MGIKILEEGFFTTVQDLGRFGMQSLGFSVSGVMDPFAARLANILLNNDENEAILEMSFLGPTITFETDMVICLTGADMTPKINGKLIPLGKAIPVKAGDTLQLRTAKSGVYGYLAVKGGFDIPETHGSKSTDTKVHFGGYQGRTLQAGDCIAIHRPLTVQPVNWCLSHFWRSYMWDDEPVIHFIEGRHYDWFDNESKHYFEVSSYQLSTQSNRMGYRLHGQSLSLLEEKELLTEAVSFGTIQVPPNGQPIALMADRQPTGGYPKIGQVIEVDLPKLSQLPPNKAFSFKKCTLDEAYERLFEMENNLLQLKAVVKLKWRETEPCM